jgi:hypothetical protein
VNAVLDLSAGERKQREEAIQSDDESYEDYPVVNERRESQTQFFGTSFL